MYNRYIPQADGTYRRSAQQDRTIHPEQRQNTKGQNIDPPRSQPEVGKASSPGGRPCHQDRDQHKKHCSPPAPPKPEPCREPTRAAQTNVMTFLRRLLPREFDTGDLLIVLLILLMAGDCRDEQNTALLTLVLYLFL